MTRRVRWVLAAAATMVVGGVAMSTSTGTADADPTSSSTEVSVAAAHPSSATADTTTAEPASAVVTDLDLPDGVAVGVLDLDDGDSVTVGEDAQYDTASIVKVDIIAALLWQNDGDLNTAQQQWATAAITYSDNAATTSLYREIGGQEGLDAFHAEIGLTDTEAGADGSWGLTQTTITDQLRLLEVVFGDDAVLDDAARDWLAGLMGQVVDSQRFGVSAAADDPSAAELKVGYLQRSATALWDVTSIGRIEADGHTLLVAVLSEDQTTFEGGRTAIDAAVQAAVDAIG